MTTKMRHRLAFHRRELRGKKRSSSQSGAKHLAAIGSVIETREWVFRAKSTLALFFCNLVSSQMWQKPRLASPPLSLILLYSRQMHYLHSRLLYRLQTRSVYSTYIERQTGMRCDAEGTRIIVRVQRGVIWKRRSL